MNTTKITKDDWTPLTIIHIALSSGVMLFALIALFTKNFQFTYELNMLIYIYIGIIILTQIASVLITRMKLDKKNRQASLGSKFASYRNLKILQMGLCEGPALLGVVLFFLYGSVYSIMLAALLWSRLLSLRPNKDNFIQMFELNADERRDLH